MCSSFSPAEQAIATALCDQLLDQAEDARLPVVNQIDARLAEKETDGWHYEGMPGDGTAWRLSLAALSGIPEVLFVTRRQPGAGPGRGGGEHLAG